jgi:ATP-dependent helicase YprA (DUF1998 family)
MDVFDLDRSLVSDYEQFARSFTQIRAEDIRQQIDAIYASRRFWPEPLVSINPHFERGATIEELVADGSLGPETGRVFRIDGKGITFYRHQAQAVAKAAAHQSFVVTTGTGSGKSLCFFVPIIDHVIRARAAGEVPRTKAIIIYPMNALANSQMKELERFIEQSDLPQTLRPTFARYTGQESSDERDLIRAAKPDILLTNFMMLELLMTRQSERDKAVIRSAVGLDFWSWTSSTPIVAAKGPMWRCWFVECATACAARNRRFASVLLPQCPAKRGTLAVPRRSLLQPPDCSVR